VSFELFCFLFFDLSSNSTRTNIIQDQNSKEHDFFFRRQNDLRVFSVKLIRNGGSIQNCESKQYFLA
jgi:hypothetical protein